MANCKFKKYGHCITTTCGDCSEEKKITEIERGGEIICPISPRKNCQHSDLRIKTLDHGYCYAKDECLIELIENGEFPGAMFRGQQKGISQGMMSLILTHKYHSQKKCA